MAVRISGQGTIHSFDAADHDLTLQLNNVDESPLTACQTAQNEIVSARQ